MLLPVLGALHAAESGGYQATQLACMIFAVLAGVTAAGAILFTGLLPAIKLTPPRILHDVVVGAASLVAIIAVASRAGINLSGLIATSAVLTAVIGLSLQDTLGNIVSGLAIQTDDSMHVGDWVKVGDLVGRVTEIRWRYTAIETRNWETVIVPNGHLVKNQVLVLGRRQRRPVQLRRWVWFNVDFRFQPTDVIAAVLEAVHAAPIANVADDPPPSCVLMDISDSYCRYAVRYWLTDLFVDDPTDSAVRTRIYFALQRSGYPLSLPAHAVFLTKETSKRKTEKTLGEKQKRVEMLERIPLFRKLAKDELEVLAESLRYAPFAPGEIMTRQGAEAHWLYIMAEGRASIRVGVEGGLEEEVAKLGTGDFFGERSLLTGEPRSATVVALTDVECYRLDKTAFQDLMKRRPEIAEEAAEVLAERQMELEQVRDNLSQEAADRKTLSTKADLVGKIRKFFYLD